MKLAVHNEYFDTLGGGELYTLRFALAASSFGFSVDIESKNVGLLNAAEARFGLPLSPLRIVDNINRGDGYDACFWVSDGSIPTLKSRNNILHFQVPFHGTDGRSLLNKMKLFRINTVLCNSVFTKKFVDSEYGVNSTVIHPPCNTKAYRGLKNKDNTILYVGRYSRLLQSKGQDVLISAFKKFVKNNPSWTMVLAGGSEVGSGDYVHKLRSMSKGYRIKVIENPNFKEIVSLYAKAKVFWSASGYGVNSEKNPELLEHFGITVVEAMASGAVPICVKCGGHTEIIEDGLDGFLWDDPSELIGRTTLLCHNKNLMGEMGRSAVAKAEKFDIAEFDSKVRDILLR